MAQIILDSNNNLIQGDFDNATLNNRTKLQTTTTNATTNVYVVPNGSSTSAGVSVANNSSLTNASKIVMATNGSTDTQIISGVNGDLIDNGADVVIEHLTDFRMLRSAARPDLLSISFA